MGLFDLFKRAMKQTEEAAAGRARKADLAIYAGMRVEVTSADRSVFLAARLQGLRGDRAQLKLSTDAGLTDRPKEPIPVTLRGYSSKENRAAFLMGTVRVTDGGVWQVEDLRLVKWNDNRANVRVETDAEGTVKLAGGPEEPCRLVNISQGGVCVGIETCHEVGDTFTLRVKPYPEAGTLVQHCQFLRILERRQGYYEYGCKFIDLSPADEERILRCVTELQKRGKKEAR